MKKTDTFSHYREGKSQMQRFLAELDPGNLELHDFDLFDWLLFANNFANRVNYFDKDDNTKPKGNWGNFFLGDDAFGEQKSGGQLKVVARSTHRDGQRAVPALAFGAVADADFQRLFGGQHIGGVGRFGALHFLHGHVFVAGGGQKNRSCH